MNSHTFAAVSKVEFDALESLQPLDADKTSALLDCNLAKNRYSNNLPLEKTRVVLKPLDAVAGSDYINASHVKGMGNTRYIAAQAPLAHTMDDFWQMVSEQEVSIVIGLAEDDKAAPYWPLTLGSEVTYAGIRITLENEKSCYPNSDDLIVRKMLIKADGKPTRRVLQLHYQGWPDFGCPTLQGVSDLLGIIGRATQLNNQNLILVHCSAGLGRTGCLIALHIFLEWATSKRPQCTGGRGRGGMAPDMGSVVKYIRKQRPGLVQTPEQYNFIRKIACAHLATQKED